MKTVLRIALTVIASASFAARAAETVRPNVVFIIADDMTRDLMNWTPEGRGKNLTPNLDRLAAEGVILTGQHIVSPVCTPSRFNCLTGRYASRDRSPEFVRLAERAGQTIITWNAHILPDDPTLAKMLRTAGYRTGFVGKNHTMASPRPPKIAPEADAHAPEVAAKLRDYGTAMRGAVRACGFDFAGAVYPGNAEQHRPAALQVHNMDYVAQAGLEFLDEAKGGPFFLYFSPTLCHSPYPPRQSWNADPLATPEGFLDKAPDVLPPRATLPERLKKAGIPGRNKEMALWLDDAVGALLARLERNGVLDRTIVFFFNDNGQEGKGSIYQCATHNPSIVWRKGGFPCGRTCAARVTNLDFAPTILDLAGAPAPADAFDGVSFRPALEGGPWKDRDALFFELGFTRGVLIGTWKYIAVRYPPNAEALVDLRKPEEYAPIAKIIAQKAGPNPPPYGHIGGNNNEFKTLKGQAAYFDADQLYDLSIDPGEQVNLAKKPEHAAKLAEMKTALKAHLDRMPGGFADLKPAR